MKCPRCETPMLDEKDRDGIVVDACAQCRGIWLDRGELEKLIARATRELDEIQAPLAPQPAATPASERSYAPQERPQYPQSYQQPPRPRRDSDPDYRYGTHDPRYRHRKKSFIESLGDIFD